MTEPLYKHVQTANAAWSERPLFALQNLQNPNVFLGTAHTLTRLRMRSLVWHAQFATLIGFLG